MENNNEVTIVDIKMPFMSIVTFMVKAAIATIPAFIILGVLFAITTGFIEGYINTINTN